MRLVLRRILITVIAALCDEIALWSNEEGSANPDEEILNGLRPAMATIRFCRRCSRRRSL